MGSFKFFLPKDAPHEIEVTPNGTRLVNCGFAADHDIRCLLIRRPFPDSFEIRVYCGETELRAAVYSDGEVSTSTPSNTFERLSVY